MLGAICRTLPIFLGLGRLRRLHDPSLIGPLLPLEFPPSQVYHLGTSRYSNSWAGGPPLSILRGTCTSLLVYILYSCWHIVKKAVSCVSVFLLRASRVSSSSAVYRIVCSWGMWTAIRWTLGCWFPILNSSVCQQASEVLQYLASTNSFISSLAGLLIPGLSGSLSSDSCRSLVLYMTLSGPLYTYLYMYFVPRTEWQISTQMWQLYFLIKNILWGTTSRLSTTRPFLILVCPPSSGDLRR